MSRENYFFVCFPLFRVLTGRYLRSRSSIYDHRDSDRETMVRRLKEEKLIGKLKS